MRLQGVLIFSEDPNTLVEFYKKVLQQEPTWSGGDFTGFVTENEYLTIGPHDKVHGKNTNPERIMINFETDEVEKEFERIKALGTPVVAEPYAPAEESSMQIATFQDPDGNYFQLTSPIQEG